MEWCDASVAVFAVCAVIAVLCFLVQELTGNYSQVDKLWSLTPALYVLIILFHAPSNPRLLLMAGCVVVWSVRLTWNFNRRGGYHWPVWEGEEDYRWPILRERITSRVLWTLFSFLFIAVYQHLLLLLLALPALSAYRVPSPLTACDWVLAGLIILMVVLETLADNQQYAFQTRKYALKALQQPLTGDYKRGFLTQGLFAFCRHPNYAAEQAIWILFALFPLSLPHSPFPISDVMASRIPFNLPDLTCVGAILLVLLFQGSARFSEGITTSKYPSYREYQHAVPHMFLPLGARSHAKRSA